MSIQTLSFQFHHNDYYEEFLTLQYKGETIFQDELFRLLNDSSIEESKYSIDGFGYLFANDMLWLNLSQGPAGIFQTETQIFLIGKEQFYLIPKPEFLEFWDQVQGSNFAQESQEFPPLTTDLMFFMWIVSSGYTGYTRIHDVPDPARGLALTFQSQLLAEDPFDMPSIHHTLSQLEQGHWSFDIESIQPRGSDASVVAYLDDGKGKTHEWHALSQVDRTWAFFGCEWMARIRKPEASADALTTLQHQLEDILF